MAFTDLGAGLTENHRTTQLAIKAEATRAALSLWTILDPGDLDARLAVWLDANIALIQQLDNRSQQAAAAYFTSFAQVETGRFYKPPAPATIDLDQVRTNLHITGPIAVKALLKRGHPLDRALHTSQVRVAGETARLAMQGHRRMLADALNDNYGDNPPPVGYARVTSGKPCAFCAMLAGRGPVYRSDATGGFRAHGHCSCTVEPVFRDDQPWPGRAREFHDLWNQATREARESGDLRRGTANDALNAFRRAFEPST